jgi:ketosteroid isomerase-like protein
MSAHLDLVRSIYADWERGDFSSVEWADPEIEYIRVGGLTGNDPISYKGLAGMAEGARELLENYEDFRIEAEDYRELDGGRVLVLTRGSGRGKRSGIQLSELHQRAATVLHIRDGKVTRYVVYVDRDRALADLGLIPESEG